MNGDYRGIWNQKVIDNSAQVEWSKDEKHFDSAQVESMRLIEPGNPPSNYIWLA